MIKTIIKRNGSRENFEAYKIQQAIEHAFNAVQIPYNPVVYDNVLEALKHESIIPVEKIQDIIEHEFMKSGEFEAALNFIKYRFLHKLQREQVAGAYVGNTWVDCKQTVEEYIGNKDWRIKANSNTTYSNAGLVNNTAGKIVANYWLDQIYTPEEGAAHRNGDYHIHDLDCLTGYCFTGDTKVVLLDGTTPTFKELVDKYKDGARFWVVSRNSEGNIVPGRAHHPRLIKKDADLVEVTISGGAKIVCTPDHEFMLRDGSYKQAKDLKKRDSLMPYYVSNIGSGYLRVRDAKLDIDDYLHRVVAAWKLDGDSLQGKAVHHLNGNKTDNRPENLEIMEEAEHRRHELNITVQGETWKKANAARLVEYNKSEEKRTAVSEVAFNRVRDDRGRFYNHTVQSVVMLERKEDVYCLTVEEHENFALEAGVFVHNCAGWSLRNLLNEGFNGVRSRVNSRPPKHFREALGQMANFLGILQSEWAGAQAFSSFDTYLAPYLFRDQLPFKAVKKALRGFVYNLNVPSRWGQSPFTNVTIDWTVPRDLREQPPFSGGAHLFENLHDDKLTALAIERGAEGLTGMTYKHFQPEMKIITKAFYEVLTEGDSTGQPFTFPIPTVNITEDFDWDDENVPLLFENSAKIGSSYFQNFIGSQYKYDEDGNKIIDEDAYKPDAVRSMCPLTADTKVVMRSRWEQSYLAIGQAWNNQTRKGVKYECFYDGNWIPCRVNRMDPQPLYTVTMTNNDVVRMGAHHLQPILRDGVAMDVEAKDLKVGDYIPYNSSVIPGALEGSSYNLGYAIGAYLGDGSKNNDGITFSLSVDEKDDETERRLKTFFEGNGYRVTVSITNRLRSVKIGGNSFSLVSRFVTGSNALDKGIAETINTLSSETRRGILDGLIATDGSRVNRRISTSSNRLVHDIQALCNSLGIRAYLSYTDARENRLGSNPNYIVSVCESGKSVRNKVKHVNGAHYGVIERIEVDREYNKYLYCLAVDSDEHLFVLKNGMITHNCRLQLDLRELLKRGGGLFGSAEMTGSIGVVTINMARLGYLYKGNKELLYKRLGELMDLAKDTLEKKREFVNEMYDRGLYPYTKRYLPGFRNHFSTIGLNGVNEMLRNFSNDRMNTATPEGIAFAEEVLHFMRERIRGYQEQTGNLYNLEATPAEGTTHRFAREDQKRYPDIIQSGTPGHRYYTNSSQLPVGYTHDLFQALKMQDKLQCCYTGGTVFHMYMNEAISSPEACRDIVRKVLTNFKMPYITVTPLFSVCEKHGYLKGRHDYCPICDEEIIRKERSKA